MGYVLTEEQEMLRETAQGFLAENAPVAQLRKLRDEKSAEGYDPSLWAQCVEMGWTGITIDEAYGGLGLGYRELGLIFEQVGHNLCALPLQSSILVSATLLGTIGSEAQKQTWLPRLVAGEAVMTLALQEGKRHAPHKTALRATENAEGYVLSGHKTFVSDAHVADCFIVAARTGGEAGEDAGLSLFLIDRERAGVSTTRTIMADSRNNGTLTLDDVRVCETDMLGTVDEACGPLQHALDVANIVLSAELLGISAAAFSMTVDYLKDRRQFGKTIGAFQGLQHRAAHLFTEIELGRSIVARALDAIDTQEGGLARTASACKAKLCEIATLATNEGIQMHGGIGMTDEYEIGFFIKRARVIQQTFGDATYHLDRFARLGGY